MRGKIMAKHELHEVYTRMFRETPGGILKESAAGDLMDLKAYREQHNLYDAYDFVDNVADALGKMGEAEARRVAEYYNIRDYDDMRDLAMQLGETIFEQNAWYLNEPDR